MAFPPSAALSFFFSRSTSSLFLFQNLPAPLLPQREQHSRASALPPAQKHEENQPSSHLFLSLSPSSPFQKKTRKKNSLPDACADAADAEKKAAATEGAAAGGAAPTSAKDYVHIRVQQRNGRKSLTTIQGLDKSFDYKKIIKAFKKEFCCNGTVVDDAELGAIIQLQGDQRVSASAFLVDNKIVKKAALKIHGF